jgi:hypothetical protein
MNWGIALVKLIVINLFITIGLNAQTDSPINVTYKIDINGDTIVLTNKSYTSKIKVAMTKEEEEMLLNWLKLLRDVDKVMPLAMACAQKVKEADSAIANFNKKKETRKYIKAEEEKLWKAYEEALLKLNRRQGALLVKLVERQTNTSAYELIRKYKSGFSATKWQFIAKRFDIDLKSKYDIDQDFAIEEALKAKGYIK